jgi:hypothetical protein
MAVLLDRLRVLLDMQIIRPAAALPAARARADRVRRDPLSDAFS